MSGTPSGGGAPRVGPVDVRDRRVGALVTALTAELAAGGYTAEQTFGYPVEELERSGVHLVGAWFGDRDGAWSGDRDGDRDDASTGGELAGIGGVETQPGGLAELRRFYVSPDHRGSGVADALLAALVVHAAARGVRLLRLETGDRQHAAIAFYRRHGFVAVPRFAPYEGSATSVCMQREVRGGPSGA